MWPRQPINLSALDKSHTKRGGLLNKHFCRKKSNISNGTTETVNFRFTHYKSMGTLTYHSNHSSYPTGIKKKKTYVDTNVLSMYAKLQLYPPYGFGEEDFLTFLRI